MRTIKFLLAIVASIAVAACGGGGGGSTGPGSTAVIISGTAAAGAPVVGYVSVRDSSNKPQPVKTNIPIEADGNYSVDVTGLTAPYAFLATGTVGGRAVSLYSAATSADEGKTINITPFTDLMIRNIAATAVDAYLAGGGMANLTTAQLDAQRISLTTQLAPALTAMGLSSSIDLLRATFNADSTGLDRFMDVVKVDTTNPGAVTITNILDAANKLIINTTTGGTATGTLGTNNLAPSGTPFDSMLATSKSFSAFFATGLPNPANTDLLALFSSTFMEDGEDASAFLTEITTEPELVGMRLINLVVDSVDTETGIAQVHFTLVNAAGENLDPASEAMDWLMKLDTATGKWQLHGNQRIAAVHVNTTANKNTCNPANTACSNDTTYNTGLRLEINNRGRQAIGSALVKGPGLPAGGVRLTQQISQTWFNITTANSFCPYGCGNGWYMTDGEIVAVLPASIYTVRLFDPQGAAIPGAVYTEVVPVAPVLNTAVASLAYPSVTGMVNLNTGITTATLTPSWTIPAGLRGDWLSVNMWQNGTNANLNIGQDLLASSGTATLVITAPTSGSWTSGNYWISASDQYDGQVSTNYQ